MSRDLMAGRLDPPTLKIDRNPWSFSLVDDELVDVCWRGASLLSGVRVVVRDDDWRTVPARVASVTVTEDDPSICLSAEIEAAGLDIEFSISLRVEATTETLTFDFTGTANVEFMSNRIGFVVLHPMGVKGAPVVVEHASGGTSESAFPELISPHQPFIDVAGMRWRVGDIEAHLAFEGDVFETEDQRNWTDASFKTYSRPLDLPVPFAVEEDQTFSQRLVLSVDASANPKIATRSANVERVVVGQASELRLPRITSMAGYPGERSEDHADLALDVLLAEVDLTQSTWREVLDHASASSQAHDSVLDLRLVVDEPDAGAEVLDLVEPASLIRLAVFDRSTHLTEVSLWEWLLAQRERLGPSVDLIAGTRAHFTELNRSHERLSEVLEDCDGVTFGITPQMHSTEVRHIVSSLQAQEDVAASAAEIVGPTPIHVGPITLESRFNAVAPTSSGRERPAITDPLTKMPFAAAWMVGSVAALSREGVESLAYFRINDLAGTQVARLFDELRLLGGRSILDTDANTSPELAVLPVRTEVGVAVFLANLSQASRIVEIECPGGDQHRVDLEPWSSWRIDCRSEAVDPM